MGDGASTKIGETQRCRGASQSRPLQLVVPARRGTTGGSKVRAHQCNWHKRRVESGGRDWSIYHCREETIMPAWRRMAVAFLATAGMLLVPVSAATAAPVSPEHEPTAPDGRETTLIEATDGSVTVIEQVSASCSRTYSSGSPYKSSGRAGATFTVRNGSGCATLSYTAILQREACGTFGCNNWVEASRNDSISSGSSVTFSLLATCGNTDSDRWRSMVQVGASTVSQSSWKWLSCGM